MAGSAPIGRLGKSDFDALLRALSSTAKGRAFLAEHLRRGRPRETRTLMEALQRIEAHVDRLHDQLRPDRMACELRRIAKTLEAAGASVENAERDPAPVGERGDLLDRARTDLLALADNLAAIPKGFNGPNQHEDFSARPPAEAPPVQEARLWDGDGLIVDDLALIDPAEQP